ncbi:Uncharacterized protein dnm_075210 [Desulfonema magnum]|uniref:Uncharacterized protein n=1 Tax=Desulfonema magnum TaxID=45655 RepID=A0A975GRW1_9BACT|nr:Uncharacterized protein dnm_075210 [Desulfonema magnum]
MVSTFLNQGRMRMTWSTRMIHPRNQRNSFDILKKLTG